MKRRTDGTKYLLFAAFAVQLLLPAQHGMAQTISDSFNATNGASTNYFLGRTGIGTANPVSTLHVAGDLTVSGAMAVPKQGDVGMGNFTNGASVQGVSAGWTGAHINPSITDTNHAVDFMETNLIHDAAQHWLQLPANVPTNAVWVDVFAFVISTTGNTYLLWNNSTPPLTMGNVQGAVVAPAYGIFGTGSSRLYLNPTNRTHIGYVSTLTGVDGSTRIVSVNVTGWGW